MNYSQLTQYVIDPELLDLGLHSKSATELLVLTTVVESKAGRYLHQLHGPALGMFQMEPGTHDDCWDNFLKYKEPLAARVRRVAVNANAQEMIWNLRYATAMARVKYLRAPEALPPSDDVQALAQYYKTHYNSAEGKSTVDKSVAEYKAYIGESA